jgi:aminoglycoside 6-adenylyltransferase
VVERLENPDGFPSRLVYYAGGKLDFTIVPADAAGAGVRDRAFVVLVDKDARTPPDLSSAPYRLPTAEEFDECLNWTYAAAIMIAKAVVRDEPWSAKFRDVDLKQGLLRLIEWDHRSRHGLDYDTRYLGTRMRAWMDRDIQDALESCWARFDAADSAAALLATVDLVALVARRPETRLGLDPFRHDRLREEITRILGMRPELREAAPD